MGKSEVEAELIGLDEKKREKLYQKEIIHKTSRLQSSIKDLKWKLGPRVASVSKTLFLVHNH